MLEFLLRRQLEVEHDAGREAAVVLFVAKETRLQVVALEAPRQSREKMVVQPPSQGGAKGSVRSRIALTTRGHVAGTKQSMSKGSNLSDRGGHARTEQEVIFT